MFRMVQNQTIFGPAKQASSYLVQTKCDRNACLLSFTLQQRLNCL